MSKKVLLAIIAVALLSIAGGVTYLATQKAEEKRQIVEIQKQAETQAEREAEASLQRFSPAARKAIEEQRRKQKNSGN